jgi:hypothetical protein
MDSDEQVEREPLDRRTAAIRIGGAFAVAFVFCLAMYWLAQASVLDDGEPYTAQTGLINFSFMLITPTAVCAFVSYLADIRGDARFLRYAMVPVVITVGAIVIGAVALQEGVICILMLSPIWLIMGLIGSALTYALRRRIRDGRKYCAAWLALPLVALQIEPMIPLPIDRVSVERSAVIEASPEELWPLLRGIPDVRPGEGRWNLSQDIIGVPRPRGAKLVGEGVGATRLAWWTRDIRFSEVITDWEKNRRIGWRFVFDDIDAWRFTDRHLMPNSRYVRIESGGYTLNPIDARRTRVTLSTTYRMRTPVNSYSALWGEFFLGDLENNLLALVKQRAEG